MTPPVVTPTLVGKDYFSYVRMIRLNDPSITNEDVEAMIPHISQFRVKADLNAYGETSILIMNAIKKHDFDRDMLLGIKEKLPHCWMVTPVR